MPDSRRFIIVGASLAGATAAATLREEGFEGEVVLIGEEPVRPYERPPLSKDYLQGKVEVETVFVHEEGYYDEHDIGAAALHPGGGNRRASSDKRSPSGRATA